MTRLCLICWGPALEGDRVCLIGLGPSTFIENGNPAQLIPVPGTSAWLSATLTVPVNPLLLVHEACVQAHRNSEAKFGRPVTWLPFGQDWIGYK